MKEKILPEERDPCSGPFTPFHQILAQALVKAEEARALVVAAQALLVSKRDEGHFRDTVDHATLLVGELRESTHRTYFDSVRHLPDVSNR